MYRRPKFLDSLLEIRREMAREADHDVAAYVNQVLSGENATAFLEGPERSVGLERSTTQAEPVLEGRSRTVR